ncbi:hypothetical protein BLA29_005762 [Euroglyphus maynei]|uniref:Uncharacterized protein n=1 Tax=Euroglyphus maynei TaxID=6958 RepID=A0A1Y3B1V7_EURMA|nr:hypothetical protein BLA29_005762 [Euroglyphus maynei]
MFIHRFGTLAHLLAYTEIREKKKQIDYSSLVAQLIRDKSRRNLRRRRRRYRRSSRREKDQISDSNLTTDDEEYKTDDDGKGSSDTDDVKPSDYGDVFGEMIQKLKSDQSRIEKIPKMIRKNTKQAIRRHEHHLQQMQNKIHRDSIHSTMSAFGLERDSSNASSYAHHRRLNHTNSNQSYISQQTIVEQPTNLNYNRPLATFSNNQTIGATNMAMNSNSQQNRTDTTAILTSDEETSKL